MPAELVELQNKLKYVNSYVHTRFRQCITLVLAKNNSLYMMYTYRQTREATARLAKLQDMLTVLQEEVCPPLL